MACAGERSSTAELEVLGEAEVARMQAWREALPEGKQRQGLENMRRWQHSWEQPCVRLCCFSTDCASQRCSACGRSISKDFGDRAVCMGCDLCYVNGPPADDTASPDITGYQLCRACLADESVLHDHSEFCLVDGSSGRHQPVRRPASALAPRHAYTGEMCVAVSADLVPAEGMCVICYCDFDEESNPPSAWPGCGARPPHFSDVRRDMASASGVSEGKGFAHRDCIAQWMEVQGLSYCGKDGHQPASLCPACGWQAEASKWQSEFAVATAAVSRAFEARSSISAGEAQDLLQEISTLAEVAVLGAQPELETKESQVGPDMVLELLQRAADAMHPQRAIRAIMQELCNETLKALAPAK